VGRDLGGVAGDFNKIIDAKRKIVDRELVYNDELTAS